MAIATSGPTRVEEAPSEPRARQAVTRRVAGRPAWVVVAELFIGLGWIRAAAEKVVDPVWWSGELVRDVVTTHADLALGWYQPFLQVVVVPHALAIALVVLVLQAGTGLSLAIGRGVPVALAVGMFLNLHFLAAGAVSPSAFYLVIQGVLALWLAEGSTRRLGTGLRIVASSMVALALMSLPFVSTLQPAEVVHDPALMVVTLAGLTLVGCDRAHRTLAGGRGLP